MDTHVVCDRCADGIIYRGEPAGAVYYAASTGLEFYGCPHLHLIALDSGGRPGVVA